MSTVYTIGHSAHSYEEFATLLASQRNETPSLPIVSH